MRKVNAEKLMKFEKLNLMKALDFWCPIFLKQKILDFNLKKIKRVELFFATNF